MKLQVPESAVSVTCHSSGEHQIRSDIQTFPPKLQPLKWPKRCPHHSRCITWRVLDLSCPPTQPYSGSSNPPPARHWRAHPCPPALPYHLSSLLTISSPSHADSSLRTLTAHMSKPIWTFHFLYGPEHILRAPQAPLCRQHAASARRCPHVCPWATL